ncbi:MAG TPA: hypothetical protein HA254_01215 [Candidatus Diapherotrites archaeon]|uniref:Uncharacterized protein n=1 Tax=Candidatus Iainarchaeum sp. TaxID=3101447 RepID=A0A7J4IUQ2_9ARCH|nr:hypothetical protein [Candidatus Diapherotrites archaeon]
MRKLKHPKNPVNFNEPFGKKNAANKMAIICITLLLVSGVIFLATSLSLTHSLMQYQQNEYPGYMETLVNYHVAFMIILVIAAIIFGGAAYSVLNENGVKNNGKRFFGGDSK